LIASGLLPYIGAWGVGDAGGFKSRYLYNHFNKQSQLDCNNDIPYASCYSMKSKRLVQSIQVLHLIEADIA
jgi:hypothetical protein